MAASELLQIESIDKYDDFLITAAKTDDYDLSSEKQIDLFRRSFEDVTGLGWRRSDGYHSFLALQEYFREDFRATTDRIQSTTVSVVLKLVDDWKKEGEPEYLLSRIEQSTDIRHGRRITGRVRALRQMMREDEGTDISPGSLRSFYEFLNLSPDLSYPGISVTPDSDIYVRWKGPDRSLFSIHFLPGLRVRYVIFVPDRRRLKLMDRISGTGSVDTILETADRAYGVNAWVKE